MAPPPDVALDRYSAKAPLLQQQAGQGGSQMAGSLEEIDI
jgi:hypothetical protein